MKNLSIGQAVIVTGKALVGYSWIKEINDQRRLEWWSTEPFMAVVVGQVVKQTGTYQPASSGHNWEGEYDYEGPSLTVKGTVTLWLVRQGLRNKEIMVRDEDIAPLPEGVEYHHTVRAADRPVILEHHCPMEEHHERQLARATESKPKLRITDQRTGPFCLPSISNHE